ncbi:Metal-dependent hydrolase YbeY, involved in rRNA and/or ribosome maturation and assembly [hydrothermal vent metagenome]|uniref:Metal-dependent hydrolase YbeY, involved in rRNA and/or ribosome maturation and assembly n=1 Tax=hydrothermal vent metagenome TaxID=652676 RepID=A0A1W1B8B9_9ZZZZ
MLSDREIELLICDNDTMRDINRDHRGIDRHTDVLSFPLDGGFDSMPLGSIVISSDYAISRSCEFSHTPQEEFVLLYIHGLLHLLGYDHEVDSGEMRAEEERIIEAYGLPTSLIVRTTNQ